MTSTMLRHTAVSLLILSATGCGLLDVSDPTAVEESELANATGADMLRRNALHQLAGAVGSEAVVSGLLADEFLSDPPTYYMEAGIPIDDLLIDQRDNVHDRIALSFYQELHGARLDATAAIDQLRTYAPVAVRGAHIGQMYGVRGLATLRLAGDYCPGFPLNEVVDGRLVYGSPLSTEQAFERALAEFDSALAYAGDSARVADLARLGRARALLDLGRFAEAAAAAASVATEYVWNAEYGENVIHSLNFAQYGDVTRSVADQEGGNGLAFISAGDARTSSVMFATANDGATGIYTVGKYPDPTVPVPLLSGIEARLIQAEAALQADNDSWLTILNELRATQISPALDPLDDPGTAQAQVDLLFRERAFWLFATGNRLADLRRLIRQYGRNPETVFPSGPYRLGGAYGTAISLPFPPNPEAQQGQGSMGCTGS